jgi:hypothetical protein
MSMRPRLIALLVTLGALVGAGAALGAFSQRAATRLTTCRPVPRRGCRSPTR